jgi:Protein of unknown function (DUF2586)
MSSHTIKTVIINTPTGIPGSTDGVMMIVCKGVAITGSLVLDTAYLGNSMASFTGIGITPDYDYVNSLSVYQQVSEFYKEAGDGAYLWLVVTATNTAFNTYVNGSGSTTFQNLIRGTIQSDPTMRVKMIGLCFAPPTTQQSANDFPAEVLATIQALQLTQAALFQDGFSFSAIIDGYNMSSSTTPATIITMVTQNCQSISLCITGSKPNGIASVGAALGRFSRITIGHGFGEVDDGPISLLTAYLTNGVAVPILGTIITQGTALTATHSYMVVFGPVTYNGIVYSVGQIFTVVSGTLQFTGTGSTVVDLTTAGTVVVGHTYQVMFGPITYNSIMYGTGQSFTAVTGQTSFTGGIVFELLSTNVVKLFPADVKALGDKQYMFMLKLFNQSGLYWNDGGTCIVDTTPLSTQEFNRVGNALSADLLDFLTTQLRGKNVPIDIKTKLVARTFTAAKEADFSRLYIEPLMIAKAPNTVGDISNGSLSLVGTPNGANKVDWTYTLTINGTPITGNMTGTVQFV